MFSIRLLSQSGIARLVLVSSVLTVFLATGVSMASAAQTVPNGLKRVFALNNPNLDIDGIDDKRVDVGIAVIDTGVDLEDPDLNVVDGIDCYEATAPTYTCDESPGAGDQMAISHGTGVAEGAAAIDNGIGGVGVAPGARIYAVHDIPDSNWSLIGPEKEAWEVDLAPQIAAMKWVTAHADEIDIVLGLGGALCSEDPLPGYPLCSDEEQIEEFNDAAEAMTDAGVVWVIGASNLHKDVAGFVATKHPDAITVSAVMDTDGLPGGKGASQLCKSAWDAETPPLDKDDTISFVSNWGKGVDIAAPSCATSGAMPLVAGAAAILASKDHPGSRADVEAIRAALVGAGNYGWTDESPDGVQEPLLDVSNPYLFSPNDTEPLFTIDTKSYGPPACPDVSIEGTTVQGGCTIEDMEGSFQLGVFMPNWTVIGNYEVDFDLVVDLNGDGYAVSPTINETGPSLTREACDKANGAVIPWKVETLSPEEWGQELEMQITVGLRAGGSGPGGACTQQVITVQGTSLGYATTELTQGTQSANIKGGHWLAGNPLWLSWDG